MMFIISFNLRLPDSLINCINVKSMIRRFYDVIISIANILSTNHVPDSQFDLIFNNIAMYNLYCAIGLP